MLGGHPGLNSTHVRPYSLNLEGAVAALSEKACKFTQIYVNYSSGKFTSIVNDLPFNLHSRLNGVPRFIYCSRYEKNFYILYLHINYLKPAGIFCSKFQIYIIYRRNQIYVKKDSFT
jgi:hypothetical protein